MVKLCSFWDAYARKTEKIIIKGNNIKYHLLKVLHVFRMVFNSSIDNEAGLSLGCLRTQDRKDPFSMELEYHVKERTLLSCLR